MPDFLIIKAIICVLKQFKLSIFRRRLPFLFFRKEFH